MPAQTGQVNLAQRIDNYVGTYQGKNKNGEVLISKVLVKAADLFEKEKYIYTLTMKYKSKKGLQFI